MSGITTHVLDTSRGAPAAGLDLELAREVDGGFTVIDAGPTDGDGRRTVLEATDGRVPEGTYRLRFETAAWFARQETACFHPHVDIVFRITDGTAHHHVPLLLSPYGYTTYRGS